MPEETKKEILKASPSPHLPHRHVGTIRAGAKAHNQRAAGKRIWLIIGVFITAIALLIAGFALYVGRQNERVQTANQYKSQSMTEEARISLLTDTVAPADYLVIPSSSGTVAVSASGPLVLDANGNLSCPSCVTGVVPSATTLVEQITNNYTTVEAITNNYSSLEQITNNYITNTYDTLSLSAGAGIAVSEVDGEYIISASGVANESLSNLTNVALNTHLLPATSNGVDVGSGVAAFRSGYYGTSVHTPTLDTLLAGQLTIGMSAATSILLGADTIMATGKSLAVNGAALFKNDVNSTSAFQIQDSAGAALLNANTSQGTLSVGAYNPTVVWSTPSAVKTNYTTGTNPHAITNADFNSDGKTDLAVVNYGSNSASVFLNNGNGTFAPKVDYTTGSSPRAIANADFNGDGKADLAVANYSSSTISIFLGNGNGTFAPKADYVTGSGAYTVTAADFNGDGKTDLAVANYLTSTVSLLLNNGNGTFAAKVDYTTSNMYTKDLAVADFNGDGSVDMVVANGAASTFSIFLNNGNGTFAAKVDHTTGMYPSTVTSADFNGDGKADLAMGVMFNNTVAVHVNNGNGTFAPKVEYAANSSTPSALRVTDFNNDGKVDLVGATTSYYSVSVYLGNGNGTFAPKQDYSTGVGSGVYGFAATDLNGDGSIDFATANYAAANMTTILFGVSTGTPVAQVASRLVINSNGATVGQLIQGSSGQTADLLQVRSDLNTILLGVGATGNVTAAGTLTVAGGVTASSALSVAGTFTGTGSGLFKNTTNSTTAFQVQQASGTSVLSVDTANARVGIGTAAPVNKLSVNTLTTANTTTQVAIGTGAVGNKGLVIQGIASQAANLFEAQSSTGVVMASVGATGVAIFKNVVDSVSAFQIQNSSSQALLGVDTVGGTISVGTSLERYTPVSKVDYTTGSSPQSHTAADFNSDGKPDLAVANQGANSISILMNNGSGTFAAKVDYTTGTAPQSITSADFNSDGKPDLAVANVSSNTISVFMNNGNGTFAAKVDYATGTGPQSITSADYNGDGMPDLATTNGSVGTISVFINTGTGTFAAKVDYPADSSYSITSADVNGDSKSDLVLANWFSNTISVFMNNGNGTFAAKVTYATGANPYIVAAGDLNGDLKPDLAVTNRTSGTVSILFNTGTGTFAAKVDYATGSNPRGIAIADLNADLKPDLAVTNTTDNALSAFLNNGNGTFAPKVDYATGTTPYSVVAVDLNGDTKVDQVVTNAGSATVSVFINGGVAITAPKLVVNTSFSSVGQIIKAASGQTADLLQVKDSANNTLHSIGATGNVLFKNNVNSTSAFQVQDTAGAALLNANTTQGTLSVGTYVPTVVWSTAPVTRTDYATGANPQGITKADVNGDGKIDLIASNISSDTVSVFISNGNGTFAAKVDYVTGVNPRGVTSADFNGDNKPDLVVGNWGANTISVLINNGNGTFAAKVDYATNSRPQNPTSADYNGDGRPDVAVAHADTNAVSVFINNGNGTFAAKADYTTGVAGITSWAVTSADFNADGKVDLAVTNSTAATVSVFINNGNGTFAAKVDYATGEIAYGITSADFNGDNKPDLAVTNATPYNTVSVFINNGTGTFAAKVDYATSNGSQSVTAADLNGDSKIDLAVANSNSNTVSVFAGSGTGTFAAKVDYATGGGAFAITNGDFNSDGVIDLATANSGGSSMSVLLFGVTTGTSVVQAASKLVVNSGANAIGQIIQGTAGQTADLLQVRDDLNKTLFSIGSTGSVTAASALNVVGTFTGTGTALFKNSIDSATAFQVQQASGNNVFSVDTNVGRVAIGTASPGSNNKLSVNALTTGDTSVQVAISTGMNSSKGLVIQGVSGQSVDLLQAQSSTGAVLASISATGMLTVASAVVSGNITINGHIITGGTAPTIAAGTAACTASTVSVSGNDTSGTVTIMTGTACSAIGSMATVTFNAAFGTAPRIILSPKNADATNLKWYNGNSTTTTFTVDTATIPADATMYTFNYWAVQ